MAAEPGILFTITSFALVIGLLVFIHEMGHYLAGRAFGVKADVFSIGFGTELFGWTDRQGTRWKVALLPLGGYVKFAGDMNPASQPSEAWLMLPPEERARTFQGKTLFQRSIIVLAGPVTNFLFAILIFAGFFAFYGHPRTPPVVAVIAPNSAAAAADLQPGDRILRVNGSAIDRFEDIARIVSIRPGESLPIVIERPDGTRRATEVMIGTVEEIDRFGNRYRIGRLGISPGAQVIERIPVGAVIVAATQHTFELTGTMVETLGQVITGRRSAQELGGPLKIAQFSGATAAAGFPVLIEFIAFISINLGFINLLPVPMLDGGHLLFYGLEAVRRRPLQRKTQEWAFMSGLVLLMSLMLFVTLNDLASFGFWASLAALIG